MYAAILQLSFPPDRHAEVSRFLAEEMMAVIRDNDGFVDFQVLDAGVQGELSIMDTWDRREDAVAAINRPSAQAVHARYAELEIAVVSSVRYTVLATASMPVAGEAAHSRPDTPPST